jgi:hypothetical protein
VDDRDHAVQRHGRLTVRRALGVSAVLAVLAVAGVVLARTGDASSTPEAPTRAERPSRETEARIDDPAVDVDGATQAAVAAVTCTGAVVRAGMFTRPDVVAEFATPDYAATLASETTAQVNAFLVSLGATGVDPSHLAVVEAPVTATARPAGGERVVVEVWSVLVVSVPGTSVARQAWRTVTVEMVAVDGRWLVDGWLSTPGPAPALSPDAVIGDRTVVGERLAWPPAVGGEG